VANYFIVTTYGRSASHWLVKVLNMHKDIICSHGGFGGKVKPIIDVGMHVSEDYDLEAIHSEVSSNWHSISLDELFDELEKVQTVKFYGNVHGFSWTTFNEKISKETMTRKVIAANVVRHPFNRIMSSIKEWVKEEKVSTAATIFLDNEFDRFYDLFRKYLIHSDIDFSVIENKRLFFAITHTLIQDARDLSIDGWHLPMERLTSDNEFFLKFINYLTGESLDNIESYILAAGGACRTNYSSSQIILSVSSYESLPEWAQGLLANMLKDLQKSYHLLQSYSALGYDLSCCIEGNVVNFFSHKKQLAEQSNNHEGLTLEAFMSRAIRSYLQFGYQKGESILIYGAGFHSELFLDEFKRIFGNISKLLVICPFLEKIKIRGLEVRKAESELFISDKKVVISSYSHEDEIYNRLISQGVSKERIIKIYS